MIRTIACSVLIVSMIFAASKAQAKVVTVYASHDSWMDANDPDVVKGNDETMSSIQSVEDSAPHYKLKQHAILKFDWDAVPGFYGSTVNGATLKLQNAGDNGAVEGSGAIHNVQADWDESTATYNLGGSTGPGHGIFEHNDGGLYFWGNGWFDLGGEADSIMEWDLEGADGADLNERGGQADNDHLGLVSRYASGDYSGSGFWPAGPNPLSLGSDIVNPNYGLLIRSGAGTKTWYTSENTVGALKPQIVLDYDPIPEPATLGLLSLGSLLIFARRRR